MIPQNIFERILNSGSGSTSLQTLYSGYQYFLVQFDDELGVIAYILTSSSWIGASEPVVSEKNLSKLLKAFKEAAHRADKTAAMLPVSGSVAKLAREDGYYCVQIGNEPWYRTGKEFNYPSIRSLKKKGSRVEKFDPHFLTVNERIELDELTARWRASRKMADLSFLNRVEPWLLFREKKYYRMEYQDQPVAYLAAVPVKARNAWYLVDLIRDPRAPAGTTEYVLEECSRLLKAEGISEFTLGMSPFSDPGPEESKRYPLTYWVFRFIFHRVETFYGFKSLFQFKQKFNPERWEPQYFVSLDKKVSLKTFHGLSQAVFPKGFILTTLSTTQRVLNRFSLAWAYSVFLNKQIVPRSPPEGMWSFFTRGKLTLSLFVLSVMYFFTSTDEHFHVRHNMVERYAYSLQHLFYGNSPTRGPIDLMIASFLHWDPLHIISNSILLIVFVGFLECIVGTAFTLGVFFTGIVLANPLTSLLFSPYYFISHSGFNHFFEEPDIGNSLGIFACIGALSFFVKKPFLLLSLMALSTFIYNVYMHSLLGYNHLIALAIGYGIGRRYALTE